MLSRLARLEAHLLVEQPYSTVGLKSLHLLIFVPTHEALYLAMIIRIGTPGNSNCSLA